MAGFGKSDNKKTSSSPKKLKPKAQWDKYCQLKKSTGVNVAVRVVGKSDAEWLTVGRVKSNNDEFTAEAVALQRALIAEHSKRLLPLKVAAKDLLEWAYCNEGSEEWVSVDPKDDSLNLSVKDVDKKIGFEGEADPASGFYCHYDNGKLTGKTI
eukprot:CAMPEP_0197831902 /NCGR_PEP_ID=MMETSP1437-20131217/12663_1 /TAXON_ID=49252 ORGANISM="Eucampia antarctica, Strain CCMP1452" /NCGR_SAMPLE_ID=MMETSP1437 /ASSEMBLY_ACC=CAM_ASM_001096 /LENGTH=153 /DNA_ID=CAMNT_0043435027 /DNA_START=217 /DNA_END=678 /DNA_ORIENTATION=+